MKALWRRFMEIRRQRKRKTQLGRLADLPGRHAGSAAVPQPAARL